MFQCQNILILVSSSLTYFTKNTRYQENSQIQCGRLEWKAQTNQISAQPNFFSSYRVHDLIHESEFRHLQDAIFQSRRWPWQFLTEMPKNRFLQEKKKRGRIWFFFSGIFRSFGDGFCWQLLSKGCGSVDLRFHPHFSHSFCSKETWGCHALHCSSCLCHPVGTINLDDLKWGSFLKQFGGISSSNQWGAQLKVRLSAGIVN